MTKQHLDENGRPLPAFRFGPTTKVAYTSSAGTLSAALSEKCTLALVWCSTDAFIAIGESPTATANDKPVTAKVDTPIVVPFKGTTKVSAIQQSANGTLYVTELL